MLHDHSLLLDIQGGEVGLGGQVVGVGGRGIAGAKLGGRQEHPGLRLPDVGQLVDEHRLEGRRSRREICGKVAGRPYDKRRSGHEGARPQGNGKDADPGGVERPTEHLGAQGALSRRKAASGERPQLSRQISKFSRDAKLTHAR